MPTSSPELIDLLCRWQQQRRLGIPVDVVQLCANTPELLEALKQQIAALESMERLLGTNLTIDGVDHAGPTVDREATTGGFDAGRTTTPQQVSIRSTFPSPPGYEVLSELGRGGMGVVYKALQVKAKRIVALKMILSGVHASQSALERFRIEGESIAALQHPNIVQVFDVGEHNRTPYFALEFCDGGNLAKKLAGTPLLGKDAAILVEKLARAVAEAHAKGIIHRDLKPANVLLTISGEPKVTDFGLAKQLEKSPLTPTLSPEAGEREKTGRTSTPSPPASGGEGRGEGGSSRSTPSPLASGGEGRGEGDSSAEDLTQTGAVMGTPSYMAPEQASGDTKRVGPPCDVYALGVILYECLTGRPPFKGQNYVETLDQVRHQEPVPPSQLNSKVPRDLETICLKCLRKEPEKRYAGAADLAEDVRRYLDGKPIVARAVGRGERAVKWVKRNPVVTGATLAVMLTLAIGTGVSYERYLVAEFARKAEADRVRERDTVIGERDKAIDDERLRVKERDAAVNDANARAADLKHRLGVISMAQAHEDFERRRLSHAAELLNAVPTEQRNWEWHYLKQQLRGDLFSLYGHKSIVASVTYSRDGSRILTSSHDQTARVWSARTGSLLLTLRGHTAPLLSASFSPDGTQIVTAGTDCTAKVWDARTGSLLFTLVGHSGAVNCAVYSPDGKTIATTSYDKTAVLWDSRNGRVRFTDHGNRSAVTSIAFSPDGRTILSAAMDGTAQIWNPATGQVQVEIRGQSHSQFSAAYSPDGTRVLTNDPGTVWDARTGKALFNLEIGFADNAVATFAWSPDGRWIAAGTSSGRVVVMDAHDGKTLFERDGLWSDTSESKVTSVAFSPDGIWLVAGSESGITKVLDSSSPDEGRSTVFPIIATTDVSISPDGKRLLFGDGRFAAICDIRTNEVMVELSGHKDVLTAAAFSPDGLRVATASRDKTARVWDANTGRLLLELKWHKSELNCVGFSPDGSQVVTGSNDGAVTVWNCELGIVAYELNRADPITKVAFSPDGKRIITFDQARGATLWDVHPSEYRIMLSRGTSPREYDDAFAFSPDGNSVIIGSQVNDVRNWSAKELRGHVGQALCAAYSNDGSRIVTGCADKTVRIWDSRTNSLLLNLQGHKDKIKSVAISPDGTRIVSASADGEVRVWNARVQTRPVDVHTKGSILEVRISDDGKRVVTSSIDYRDWRETPEIKEWDLATGAELPSRGLDALYGTALKSPFDSDEPYVAYLSRIADLKYVAGIVRRRLDPEELSYRIQATRPNESRCLAMRSSAAAKNDPFAERFNEDRHMSAASVRTREFVWNLTLFADRVQTRSDPRQIARIFFHYADFKTNADDWIPKMARDCFKTVVKPYG